MSHGLWEDVFMTGTCTSPFPLKKAVFKSESFCVLGNLAVFSTCICWSKQRSCLSVGCDCLVSFEYHCSTDSCSNAVTVTNDALRLLVIFVSFSENFHVYLI